MSCKSKEEKQRNPGSHEYRTISNKQIIYTEVDWQAPSVKTAFPKIYFGESSFFK
jgi:hypothetical protein